MIEIASMLKGTSNSSGSNITIALKTYLNDVNLLVYKVYVMQDLAIVEESIIFNDKDDSVSYYQFLCTKYKVSCEEE